jgi:hypothetical protein
MTLPERIMGEEALTVYIKETLGPEKGRLEGELDKELLRETVGKGVPLYIDGIAIHAGKTLPSTTPIVVNNDDPQSLNDAYSRFAPAVWRKYQALLGRLQDLSDHWDKYTEQGYVPSSPE